MTSQRLHERLFTTRSRNSQFLFSQAACRIFKHILLPKAHFQKRSALQNAVFDPATKPTAPPPLRSFHPPKPHNKLITNHNITSPNLPNMQQKATPTFSAKTVPTTLPKLRRHPNQPRFRRLDTKQPNSPNTLRVLPQNSPSRSSTHWAVSY